MGLLHEGVLVHKADARAPWRCPEAASAAARDRRGAGEGGREGGRDGGGGDGGGRGDTRRRGDEEVEIFEPLETAKVVVDLS